MLKVKVTVRGQMSDYVSKITQKLLQLFDQTLQKGITQ